MNEMSEKEALWEKACGTTNPDKLRLFLLEVEQQIKAIVGVEPFSFYRNFPTQEQMEALDDLLSDRQYILDRMFTWSEYEVGCIERTNARLLDLYCKMKRRAIALYRCVLAGAIDTEFDDYFGAEGWMNPDATYEIIDGKAEDYGTALHLDNDEYYGSDFAYMLSILKEHYLCKDDGLQYIDECHIYQKDSDLSVQTDSELTDSFIMADDDYSWAERHRRPEIDHIVICHPFHSMFDHHDYALADIIRLNRFHCEAKIVCEKTTDLAGRRWEDIRE